MSVARASSLGQLLILGVRDHRWSHRLECTLRGIEPAGALLYPDALRSPGQSAELLHRIARTLSSPPLLAIAGEGGSVNPLGAFLPPLPAPRVVARCGPTAVKRSGELIGSALELLGFNLNLAPRLDLSSPSVEPALDTQTFATDHRLVAHCGRAFIEGLRKHRILACGKHFPGRGTPEYDKNGLPMVGKTMAELWREDLWPFRELLPDLPLLKLSNATYKAYDFDAWGPAATSSKVVHDLLRVKLGYRGLAVADPMELIDEVSRHMTSEGLFGISYESFADSVMAGCELQVVRRRVDAVLPAMQRALETGSLTRERVEDALTRVRAAKKGLKRPSGKVSVRSFDRLAREFAEFNQQVRGGGPIEA
jgi:beta-N-acetylhexosaminidase